MTDKAQNGAGAAVSASPPPSQGARGYTPARPLPYVANVSWPRSGHGLLVQLLSRTFGRMFGYCEYYTPQRFDDIPCCRSFPCRSAGLIQMSKQHDFGGKAELPDDHPLVVQYRSFLPSVVSHWDQRLATNGVVEDNAQAFREFAEKEAASYKRFLDRWVRTERTNRVLLPYEELTSNPAAKLRQVLALYGAHGFAGEMERAIATADGVTFADGERRQEKGMGVADRRDVTKFRFYDQTFFDELDARLHSDA